LSHLEGALDDYRSSIRVFRDEALRDRPAGSGGLLDGYPWAASGERLACIRKPVNRKLRTGLQCDGAPMMSGKSDGDFDTPCKVHLPDQPRWTTGAGRARRSSPAIVPKSESALVGQ
jgi:hypothetical protein